MSYLSPAPCNVSKPKVLLNINNLGAKNPLFGHFGTVIVKSICHVLNQCPQICQNTEIHA